MVALEALTNLLNNKDPVATAVLLERLNRLNENAEYKNQEKYSLELGSFLREMGIEIMRSRANTEMRISISGENNEPTVESFTDNQQRDTLPIDEYIDRLANEVEVSQSRNKIETTTRHAGKVLRGIWNIERSKTESKYDKILDSLSVAIPGLDDGFYEHIARHLDRDISDIEKNGSISFNRTWFARDPETQKRIVFKLTDRLHKAEKEIGILEKKCEFTSELVGTPFNVGPYIIYAQEFVNLQEETDYREFFRNIAYAHANFRELSKELPRYVAPSREKINNSLSAILKGEGIDIRKIEEIYQERLATLETIDNPVALHGDLKKDNRGGKYIIDWEGMAHGHPAIDIALPLIQDGVNPRKWNKAVTAYLDALKEINPELHAYYKETLLQDVQKYSVIPVIKELEGIYSRRMGQKEKHEARVLIEYLRTID